MSARTRRRLILSWPLAALLMAVVSAAHAQAPNGLPVVSEAWARATPPNAANGVAYLTLTSPTADALVGVSSPVASRAELHEMAMEGNIMRMRAVAGSIELPAGKPVTLAPGGLHIMLMGPKAPLRQGQSVPLHLTFRNAPPQDVAARVEAMGAKAAPGGSDQGDMAGMTMH